MKRIEATQKEAPCGGALQAEVGIRVLWPLVSISPGSCVNLSWLLCQSLLDLYCLELESCKKSCKKTKKPKNYRLADRSRTCDFLGEKSAGFLQSFLLTPQLGAELANWSPLVHSSWVKCGFPTGHPEGCILSAKTETKPY